MNVLFAIVLGYLALIALIFLFAQLVDSRNSRVHKYRKQLVDQIRVAAEDDAMSGRNADWRWDVFESVSYDTMIVQFWRPLRTFYPNKAFITPGITAYTLSG